MLLAATVCPHPPLLVPALTGATGPAELREACVAAVRDLLAAGEPSGDALDVVVVGTGPTPGSAAPDAIGSLSGYGADVTVALTRVVPTPEPTDTNPTPTGLSGAGPTGSGLSGTGLSGAGPTGVGPIGAATLPLSVTVGVWLLRQAGWSGPVRARVVTENATPTECADLGARLAGYPAPTVLLVMGDGSASRDEKAPGSLDPRAVPFDTAVADALASVDTAALAALDPALARELFAAGRAPWQILAGAVEADARPWKGELRSAEAPYGVGYLVATWSPA
ncbi:hypothetical protein [Cryptosporangium arvum]|uniref:hypothetical protein n=1 Tax=Cryptosporangium arvum TaxID=80871 RepID=UPI0004BC196F|nr:hypothetical protein [Cryptosporangium arvum]